MANPPLLLTLMDLEPGQMEEGPLGYRPCQEEMIKLEIQFPEHRLAEAVPDAVGRHPASGMLQFKPVMDFLGLLHQYAPWCKYTAPVGGGLCPMASRREDRMLVMAHAAAAAAARAPDGVARMGVIVPAMHWLVPTDATWTALIASQAHPEGGSWLTRPEAWSREALLAAAA